MEKDAKVKIGFFMLLLAVLGFAVAGLVGHVTAQAGCDAEPVIDGDTISKECAGTWKLSVTPHTAAFWDPDDDNDGVLDVDDFCQFSVLPESVPTIKLNPGHYADIDGDGYFESVNPQSRLITDNVIPFSKTFGCSCKEILAKKPGDTSGELKFGCTKGTMDVWSAGRGWGKN